MNTVRLDDKTFKPYISEHKIKEAVINLSSQLNLDFEGKKPVFLIILNGSFVFAADLLREINFDCEISFVKLSSYEGTSSSGSIKQLIGLNEDLKDRYLIVVEDIIDTGTTLEYLIHELNKQQITGLKIVSLLFKPDAFKKNYPIDYVGIKIPNDFIVGYGLDYNGLGRNLKDIYVISED